MYLRTEFFHSATQSDHCHADPAALHNKRVALLSKNVLQKYPKSTEWLHVCFGWPRPGVGSGGAAKVASVRRGWGLPTLDMVATGSSRFHSGPTEATVEPASEAGGTSVKAYPRKGKPLHSSEESVRNSPATGRSEQEEEEEEGQLRVLPWGDRAGAGGRRICRRREVEPEKWEKGRERCLRLCLRFLTTQFIFIGKKLNAIFPQVKVVLLVTITGE